MSGQILRFSLGVCIVAVALVLHRFSEDEAVANARLEGFQTGYRAFQNTQIDLTAACGRAGQGNPVVNTSLGTSN